MCQDSLSPRSFAVSARNITSSSARNRSDMRCIYRISIFQVWCVLFQNFVDTLLRVSNGISFLVNQPQIFYTRDDRASSYSEFLENILSKHAPQLVFCVVSNNRIDRYSAIKKKCCVDRPVPSQVYLQKNLTHKNLKTIATKVAIQMNCKLGGAPWFVEIPLDGLMVIGFDVCHDTLDSRKDVGKFTFVFL